MTPDARTLAPEEVEGLRALFWRICLDVAQFDDLLAHVTDLALAYRDAGIVEGDLAHDGTVRWEAQA